MAEYIKREDVLKILSEKNAPWNGYVKCKELPAEDVQPVVHCQDCTQWEPGYIDERDNFVPPRCFGFDVPVHFNDYCSWGVRKDG